MNHTHWLKLVTLYSCIFLAACTPNYNQEGTARQNAPMIGAGVGAVGGALAGSILQANMPMSVLVGGVVGGLAGEGYKKAAPARKVLERHGVQVVQLGDTLSIYLPTDKCFVVDTPDFKPSCDYLLENIYQILASFGKQKMTIIGNTDEVGSGEQRTYLSDQQAKAVASYLWARGISPHQLTIVAAGSSDPVGYNYNSQSSAANRRVEIDIQPFKY